MRVKFPEELSELIEKHYTRGDYADISRMLDGTDKMRQAVAMARLYKAGEETLVSKMIEFYRQKAIKAKELEAAVK